MKQEDKDLLFKDLCARLPYGVKCERYGKAYELVDIDIKRGLVYVLRDDWFTPNFYMPYSIERNDDIRPYLRLMSSMTNEEANELLRAKGINSIYDYLNAHHLDYRELIKKGLAIEAPKDLY